MKNVWFSRVCNGVLLIFIGCLEAGELQNLPQELGRSRLVPLDGSQQLSTVHSSDNEFIEEEETIFSFDDDDHFENKKKDNSRLPSVHPRQQNIRSYAQPQIEPEEQYFKVFQEEMGPLSGSNFN